MVSKNTGRTEKDPITLIHAGLIGLLVLLLPLIIWKPVYSAAVNTKYFFSGLILTVGFLATCIAILLKPQLIISRRNLYLFPLWGFWGYLMVRSWVTPDFLLSFRDSYLWILFPWLSIVMVLFTKSRKNLEWVMVLIQLSAFLVSLHGISQYFGYELSYLKWKGVPPHLKVMGTMGNPNFLAEYLLPLIPVTLAWSWKGYQNKWLRRMGFFQVILTTCCFWLTGSAEVWIVLPLCLGALVLIGSTVIYSSLNLRDLFKAQWVFPWKKMIGIPIFLLVVATGIFSASLSENWEYLKKQPAHTFVISAYVDRFMVWEVANLMILEKPLWGWGAGGFRTHYLEKLAEFLRNPENEAFISSANSTRGSNANQAHNDYLQMTVDWGLAGIFLFIGIIAMTVGSSIRKILSQDEVDTKILLAGTLLSIFFILFDSLVNFPLYLPAPSMLFWILIGITLWLSLSLKEEESDENNHKISLAASWFIRGISLFLIGLLLVSGYITLKRFKGNLAYKQGMKLLMSGKTGEADILIQRALLYDPSLGEAYLQRANYLSGTKETTLAVHNAFQAFQYGTDDVERYLVLAQAILKNGEPQRAVEILDSANIIYPRYSAPYQMKAMIYSKQWYQPALAIKQWNLYLNSGVSETEKEMALTQINLLKEKIP